MNRILGLYSLGIVAAALAAAYPSLTWLSPVTFLIILPLGAIWIWWGQRQPIRDLGFAFSGGWFRYLAIGLLTGLGIPFLFLLVQQVAGWISLDVRGGPFSNLMTCLPPVLARMILVVAIEEFLFRGFFLNALGQVAGSWTAIGMSSLLWGGSHLGSMVYEGLSPGSIAITMASFLAWGITLCLCYLIAQKLLWLPYGLHLGVNLGFSFVGCYFITQPSAPPWWIGHPAWSPESGLMGPLVWLIITLIAYRLTGPVKVKGLVQR